MPARAALAAAVLSLSACDVLDPKICTGEYRLGVRVEVVSAADGSAITDGLAGTLVEGSYVEVMEVVENELRGAGERPGTYTLVINATGYETWWRVDLRVPADECHVITQHVTAELTPSA